MPGKKKPFVDKNRSVTFRLVHRSQKDPFIANAEDGGRILAPIINQRENQDVPSSDVASVASSSVKRKYEQAKYGVYFDDEYDYLQHLRDVNEVVTLEPIEEEFDGFSNKGGNSSMQMDSVDKTRELRLPSSLFECKDVELKVGLLHQAAPAPGPHPELDPDIVAILDDDDEGGMEYDELEDDFVSKANAVPPSEKMKSIREEHEGHENQEDFGSDFDVEDEDEQWPREETRSRFTEYSLSSSVIRRTQGLQQLDARFEKIYEEYDDSELGSLDGEEEQSDVSEDESKEDGRLLDANSDRMLEMAKEFEQERKGNRNWLDSLEKYTPGPLEEEMGDDDVDKVSMERICVNEKLNQWDCESIISTYSNVYNHPKLIREEKTKKIQLDSKTGLPVGVLGRDSGLTKKNLEQLPTEENAVTPSVHSTVSSIRPKDETPEQRRLRKQVVKMERRERRCEKKANKLAFKEEETRRKNIDVNLRQNLQGLKLM